MPLVSIAGMEQSQAAIVVVIATFVVAGMVKGITGMGLPTVTVGVLGAFFSPLTAAALLLVPSFVTNVWQLMSSPRFRILLRRLRSMMVAILIGTLAGSALLLARQPTIERRSGNSMPLGGNMIIGLIGHQSPGR